jgi:hypothetical protein
MPHPTRPAGPPAATALARALAVALALAASQPAAAADPAAAGNQVVGAPAPATAPRFAHEPHLEFLSLFEARRCSACHQRPEAGAAMEVRRETCRFCHEPEPPAWRALPPLPPRASESRLRVLFAHERHAASPRLACTDCHVPTGRADGREFGADRDCAGCHARMGVSGRDCAVCHVRDVSRQPPPGHDAAWRRVHGAWTRPDDGTHGRDCRTCHGTDACIRCHRVREPVDHTSIFKARLHGVAASWERERCAACHESGACAGCHARTAPRNHNGSWRSVHMLAAGSVDNPSCAACHQPSFCANCHRGAR